MRAVIIATGLNTDLFGLNDRRPTPMLPLADRPFIQHIVETLVDRGVTEFDFVLSHLPEKIERHLGTGVRWGSRFHFHLARDAARPYGFLKSLGSSDQKAPILLAHADRLPQLPAIECAEQGTSQVIYCLRSSSAGAEDRIWTGWAWLSQQFLAALPGNLDEIALESCLMSAGPPEATLVEVPQMLSVRTYEELLAAQSAVLTKEFSGLMLSGHEAETGIWISRNVSLPPTAQLMAPVYIGENCRIGVGAQLGPNAVVGHNCVLDAHCTVTNSAIFPNSYVGQALELEDVIVEKNLLVNTRLEAAVPVSDDFILGSLTETQVRAGAARILSRAAAIALLSVTWPVLLVTTLYLKLTRRGPVLAEREFVRLPASADESQWRSLRLWSLATQDASSRKERGRFSNLLLRFLPGLINIAKGELSFVGVRPRTKAEVKLLPPDWQTLYLRSKAGIVTEAEILYGADPNEDEIYSAEAFYSAAAGGWYDTKLLIRYFGQGHTKTTLQP